MNSHESRRDIQPEAARRSAIGLTRTGVPPKVILDPLSSKLIAEARWKGQDAYPAFQGAADEFKRLLTFSQQQGQYDLYVSRLTASVRQRDAALDELRVGVHLEENRFSILQWNPVGVPPKEGEYLISSPCGKHIFVEVKSPTWQSELTKEVIAAGRTKEPKYRLGCEGGAYGHWPRIQYAIDRAYEKFCPTQANLLIIAGDGPHVSMRHELEVHADEALYVALEPYDGYFTSPAYERLGGAAFFFVDVGASPIHYSMALFQNPYALVDLPTDIERAFSFATWRENEGVSY